MANPALLLSLRARVRARKRRSVPQLKRPGYLSYAKALTALSRSISEEIRKEIFAWMDSALTVDNGIRFDAPVPVTLTRTLEGMRAGLMERTRRAGEKIATRELTKVELQNRGNMNAQFKRLIGVNPFKEPQKQVLNKAIQENVQLIVTIPQRQLSQVELIIREGIQAGIRVEALKEQVQERFSVSESRAQLIARDQVNKLNGELVEQRNKDLGIQRYTWAASNDERVRPMHAELDGQVFSWDDPPVTNEDGDRNHPGGDYQCLPGDQEITFAGSVCGGYRRWYTGELSKIVTDSGKLIQTTPNHPILTLTGWKAAQRLNIGDYVIKVEEQGADVSKLEVEKRKTTIADVFNTLILSGPTSSGSSVGSDFHNDGSDQEIDIVRTDCKLPDGVESSFREGIGKLLFSKTDTDMVRAEGSCVCDRQLMIFGLGLSSTCGVSSFSDRLSLFLSLCREAEQIGLRPIERYDSVSFEGSNYCRSGAEPFGCAGFYGHTPGNVRSQDAVRRSFSIVRVSEIFQVPYSGYVYNLETRSGAFVAQNLIVHNCRCNALPDVEGLLDSLGI